MTKISMKRALATALVAGLGTTTVVQNHKLHHADRRLHQLTQEENITLYCLFDQTRLPAGACIRQGNDTLSIAAGE